MNKNKKNNLIKILAVVVMSSAIFFCGYLGDTNVVGAAATQADQADKEAIEDALKKRMEEFRKKMQIFNEYYNRLPRLNESFDEKIKNIEGKQEEIKEKYDTLNEEYKKIEEKVKEYVKNYYSEDGFSYMQLSGVVADFFGGFNIGSTYDEGIQEDMKSIEIRIRELLEDNSNNIIGKMGVTDEFSVDIDKTLYDDVMERNILSDKNIEIIENKLREMIEKNLIKNIKDHNDKNYIKEVAISFKSYDIKNNHKIVVVDNKVYANAKIEFKRYPYRVDNNEKKIIPDDTYSYGPREVESLVIPIKLNLSKRYVENLSIPYNQQRETRYRHQSLQPTIEVGVIRKEEETIPRNIITEIDFTMPYGQKEVVEEGKDGKIALVHRSKVDPNTGVLYDEQYIGREIIESGKPKVIKYGMHLQSNATDIYKEMIPYVVTYKNDATLYQGMETVEIEGKYGEKTITTPLIFNGEGQLVRDESNKTETTVDPINKVVKRGTKLLPFDKINEEITRLKISNSSLQAGLNALKNKLSTLENSTEVQSLIENIAEINKRISELEKVQKNFETKTVEKLNALTSQENEVEQKIEELKMQIDNNKAQSDKNIKEINKRLDELESKVTDLEKRLEKTKNPEQGGNQDKPSEGKEDKPTQSNSPNKPIQGKDQTSNKPSKGDNNPNTGDAGIISVIAMLFTSSMAYVVLKRKK